MSSSLRSARPVWLTSSVELNKEDLEVMAFMEEVLERAIDAAGTVGRAALIPWGGAEACVDAYETAIRALTEAQLNIARAVDAEPVRAVLASCAEMTRDIGATHLSSVRWILDV